MPKKKRHKKTTITTNTRRGRTSVGLAGPRNPFGSWGTKGVIPRVAVRDGNKIKYYR